MASLLEDALRAASVPIFGFLGPGGLAAIRVGLHPVAAGKFGADRARGAVAAALPYGEGPPEPAWAAALPGPRAALARFARADWYGELAARLKAAAAAARTLLRERSFDPGRARDWRYLSNSGLPERRFALSAGLGELGRHGLLMTEREGSAVVLGLLLLPFDLPERPHADPGGRGAASACGDCRACVLACPTGALGGPRFERERCLQHWSALDGELPPFAEAAWGSRLYGCDVCQEACPRFRPDPAALIERGALGRGLSAAWIASAPEGEIRWRLRGSALGLGWMSLEAFRRNARIALGKAESRDRAGGGGRI